jgi:hypothetical protein
MLRRRLSALIHRLRADQHGMAVPTALFATIAGMGLVTAAAVSTVSAQRGTSGDEDRKSAIAAADAGANLALLRQNKVLSATAYQAYPCVGPGGGGMLVGTGPAADGWCPAVSGTVGGSTYTYRISPYNPATQQATIVATGTADDVSRRVAMLTRVQSGASIFGLERAIGRDWIHLDSDADVRVSMGTNGDVTMDSNAAICGNIRHGVGHDLTMYSNAHQCSGYQVTEENRDLPPLSEAKRLALQSVNSNTRFFTQDIRTGGSSVSWNSSTRTLSLNSNSTLTLGGTDYFLCRLVLDSNAGLIMAAGASVRIYFDTPEACGLPAGTSQIEMRSNSYITSTGYDPAQGLYEMPGLYMFGSTSRATLATFNSNTAVSNEFILYAPNTDVQMDSNSTYIGAMAGKSLDINSNARITSDANMVIPDLDIPSRYSGERYVECVGAVATPPNANC